MNWTNRYNLPQPVVSAIVSDPYEHGGNISITGLIKPVRMRALEIRHDAEVTEDVSERLYSLLGQCVAKVLERADTFNHLPEERMKTELNGWIVSGQPDLLSERIVHECPCCGEKEYAEIGSNAKKNI